MADQALEAIKLSSNEDRDLFSLVRHWFEARKADLNHSEPCYALVCRLLKCFRTRSIENTKARSHQPFLQAHPMQETSRLSFDTTSALIGEEKSKTCLDEVDHYLLPVQVQHGNLAKDEPRNKPQLIKIGAKTRETRIGDGPAFLSTPNFDSTGTTIHEDNLLLLLNDLAKYLSRLPCPLVNNEEGGNKLTVVDVATELLVYLTEDIDTIDDLYRSVLLNEREPRKEVMEEEKKSVEQIRLESYGTKKPFHNVFYFPRNTVKPPLIHNGFRRYLIQVLQSLQRTAIATVESFHDFEYLWASCTDRVEFASSINNLIGKPCSSNLTNENGKRPLGGTDFAVLTQEEAKECARTISFLNIHRTTVIPTNHLSFIHGEQGDDHVDSPKSSRRQRLLTSAAAMGLLSSLNPVEGNSRKISGASEINQHKLKSLPMDVDEGNEIPIVSHGVGIAKGHYSELLAKKNRTTSSEEDAIAALSMIFSAPKPSDSSPLPKFSQERDAIDVIVDGANTLHSVLAMTNPQDEVGKPIMRSEVENMIKSIAEVSLIEQHREEIERVLPAYGFSMQGVDSGYVKYLGQFTNLNLLQEAVESLYVEKVFNECDHILDEKPVTIVDDLTFSADPAMLEYVCNASPKFKSISDNIERFVCFFRIFDPDDPRVSMSTEAQVAEAIAALKAATSPEAVPTLPSSVQGVEAMHLNEWCVAILSAKEIKPSQRLMLYLEVSDDEMVKESNVNIPLLSGGHEAKDSVGWRAKIVPALNRAVYKLTDVDSIDSPDGNDKLMIDPMTGELSYHPRHASDPDLKLCIALITLYFHALECTIFQETARKKTASHPKIVQNDSFHRALLAFCYVCVLKGFSACAKLRLSERHQCVELCHILQLLECTPYSYLKVSESVMLALTFDRFKPKIALSFSASLPNILRRHISLCEIILLDSHIWSRDENLTLEGCLMDNIREIKLLPKQSDDCKILWPPEELQPTLPEEQDDYFDAKKGKNTEKTMVPSDNQPVVLDPEHQFTAYVIRKVLKIMHLRISGLCTALGIPKEYQVANQIWVAFRYLLRHHIELLYDRHIDQLLLCVLYGVCKIMRYEPELSFSTIIESYTEFRSREIGDYGCQRVVRQIRIVREGDIDNSKPKKEQAFGNVIHLYNQVFIPAMKNHLLQSKSLKKASLKLRRREVERRATDETTRGGVNDAPTPVPARLLSGLTTPFPPDIPPRPLPRAILVQKGNVAINIRLVTPPGEALLARVDGTSSATGAPIKPRHTRADIAANPSLAFAEVSSPGFAKVKTRALFTFGDTSKADIERANRMVTKWIIG